jgi:hypothetical protein
MTAITDETGTVFLGIEAVSKAARTSLYTENGAAVTVDANSQPSNVGLAVMGGLNDRSLLPIRLDRLGGVASADYQSLLTDTFEGTTINPNRWLITATTMAATQASSTGLLFNSGSITTLNTGYMIQSSKKFLKTQRAPLQMKLRARMVHFANAIMELGYGDATTFNGAVTTGAFWRRSATGTLLPVVVFNSSDISAGMEDISSLVNSSNHYTFDIFADDEEVTFTCQDTSTGLLISKQIVKLPMSAPRLLSAGSIGAQIRLYNSGTAPATAAQLILTDITVNQLDCQTNKPWSDTMSCNSRASWENPFTGAQLPAWANSVEPGNATLSNTTATYGNTVLGGKFQFAAVAGAVTDYILFGFQVPVPANLVITGVDIDTWNTGAAVATTPTLLTWSLGFGSTAISLVTTLIRVPLGAQSMPVGAAIGQTAGRIVKQFRSPVFVPSGRFLHLILRMPVATATASQVIAGMVNFEGYYE